MVSAMGLFVINDVCVKLATGVFPTGQLLAIRGGFAILTALAMVAAFGSLRDLRHASDPRVIVRGLIEAAVAFTFISALAKLPLANITAILQAASLIAVALAALTGVEQVGWRRWLAIGVGFLGVLVIVRPAAEGFTIFSLVALLSAILVGFRDLSTRRIRADVPSTVITFVTTSMVCLVGLALAAVETWVPPTPRETLYLAIAAVFVALGNYFIIVAYRDADVSLVSGFRYMVLVFAIIAGLVVWGEWPDQWSLIGAALIVASGLYTLHRQRVRAKAAA